MLKLFAKRPISTFWKAPPSRSLDKDGKPIRQTVRVRFTERMGAALGIKLVALKKKELHEGEDSKVQSAAESKMHEPEACTGGTGVMIAEIMPNMPASRSGKLRRAMRLIRMDGRDMTSCTVKDAIKAMSLEARRVTFNDAPGPNGILTEWRIAPSRNLTKDGTRLHKPATPSQLAHASPHATLMDHAEPCKMG